MKIYAFTLLFLTIISCKKEVTGITKTQDSPVVNAEPEIEKEIPITTAEEEIKSLNNNILNDLKSKNYKKFPEYMHPEKGVRFSMYAYLNDENKTFSKSDFEKYINSNIKFTWGTRDGSGETLILSIKDYLEKWVLKRDFTSANVTFNKFQGQGNSINNFEKIYPNHHFTENYIEGSKKYNGMDWNALRFVFEELNGTYYLIAVINDEWTI